MNEKMFCFQCQETGKLGIDALMLLISGRVVTRMGSDEGRVIVVEYIDAPFVLAPAFLYASDRRVPVEVRSVGNSSLLYVNRHAFLTFMQRHPDVPNTFLQIISDKTRFLTNKLNSFAVMGLRNRVLNYLGQHKTITNVANAAEQMGVARPSLSRTLSEMVAEGSLRKDQNGYILP